MHCLEKNTIELRSITCSFGSMSIVRWKQVWNIKEASSVVDGIMRDYMNLEKISGAYMEATGLKEICFENHRENGALKQCN